jgi:phage tail protein X
VKLLVGVLLFLLAFVAAATWQRSWRAEAEARRSAARSNGEVPAGESSSRASSENAWGRVIIGRPSGAEPEPPVRPMSPKPAPAQPATSAAAHDSPPTRTSASAPAHAPSAKEASVVVRSGDTLSTICRDHYGTSRAEVVQALATYNKLKSPDDLREGATLSLPPIERLVEREHR